MKRNLAWHRLVLLTLLRSGWHTAAVVSSIVLIVSIFSVFRSYRFSDEVALHRRLTINYASGAPHPSAMDSYQVLKCECIAGQMHLIWYPQMEDSAGPKLFVSFVSERRFGVPDEAMHTGLGRFGFGRVIWPDSVSEIIFPLWTVIAVAVPIPIAWLFTMVLARRRRKRFCFPVKVGKTGSGSASS